MKHLLDRTSESRAEAEFRSRGIKFRERIDIIWLFLSMGVFVILSLIWLVGVVVGEKIGLFDKPLIQRIEDARILTNIREGIDKKPLIDAVYHAEDGRIYISQKDGALYTYDISTGLWRTENPFSKGRLMNPEVIQLRSGSGTDPLSNMARENQNEDIVWGLTANGGLVRRNSGEWEIVKGDTMFTGSTGRPVKQEQLTTAAISGDKEWLAVGTQKEGIGIYHIKTHTWKQYSRDFFKNLPSQDVTSIVWSRDRFWIGGPGGLVSIQPGAEPPQLAPISALNGAVTGMGVDSMDRVWVLEKRNCRGGGMNCIRLSRFQEWGQAPDVLVDEKNNFPNLTLEDLQFAQYWDNRLILAGNAGVYSYDTGTHGWERHYYGAVSAFLPLPGDRGFYFGYTGGIGIVNGAEYQPWKNQDKRCKTWRFPGSYANEKIVKIGKGNKNEVLALGVSGALFSLDSDKDKTNVKVVFKGTRTAMNPENFRNARAFGNIVLFTGDTNSVSVTIHNIVTRSYTNVPKEFLPEWLQKPDTTMITSGGQVYAIATKNQYTTIYRIPETDAAEANFKRAENLGGVSGKVIRVIDWNGKGVGLLTDPITGGGQVVSITTQKENLTGSKAPGLSQTSFIDAAPYKNGAMLATPEGLQYYDYKTRSLGSYYRTPAKTTIREIVLCGGKVWICARQGQLLQLTDTGKFESRIGGQQGFDMGDNQVSDALEKDNRLYIAGNGWINLYAPYLRRITNRWKIPGAGNVKIVDVIGEEPIALCGGIATIGSQAIDINAGTVLNLSTDADSIWTVRQKDPGGQKYLKRYSIDDPFSLTARCYFSHPNTGGGARIFDAVALPDENIVVSTDKGLRFYSPSSRSWFQRAIRDTIPQGSIGGELYIMNRQLVMAAENKNGYELTEVNLNTINLTSSCFNEPVIIGGKPFIAKALTIDPGKGRMAFIETEKNDRVSEWYGGAEFTVLESPGKEPDPSWLKRIYGRNSREVGSILFTTGNEILRYDLQRRNWTSISLLIGGENFPADIDIENRENREIIIVKSKTGNIHQGKVDYLETAQQVELSLMYRPSTGFNARGSDILDVQQRDGKNKSAWTFVLKDRVKNYDSNKRRWSEDIQRNTENALSRPLPPALDVGWLKWKRDTKTFEVKTPKGVQSISVENFVKNNMLIFEEVNAVLPKSPNRWIAANSSGIWNYGRNDLGLMDGSITYQPINWGSVSGSAHSMFISGDNVYDIEGKQLQDSRRYHTIIFGDVVLTEDVRIKAINGRIKIQGVSRAIDAFSGKGFTWDQQKRGLAYDAAGLMIHTNAGLHPVSGYTGFETVPGAGSVYSRRAGIIYFQQGAAWYQRKAPSDWKPIAYNPKENRVMVDNKTWKWELKNGEPRVTLNGNSYGFKMISTGAGFGFTSDIIKDAAVFDNRLEVMTEAFLEKAAPPDQITYFKAPRFPPQPVRNPETVKNANDRILVNYPVKDPRFRMIRETGGRIRKEIRVKSSTGVITWKSFDFSDGQFPFDVVTSVSVKKDGLYVETGAGLQVYRGIYDTGLDRVDEIVEWRGGASAAQGRKLRIQTDYWKLYQNEGKLEGYYKDETGRYAQEIINAADGRLPHDRIKDIAVFDGQLFTMWQNGWTSIHSTLTLDLNREIMNLNTAFIGPERFIEAPQDIIGAQTTVRRGLYMETRGERVWRYSGQGKNIPAWIEIMAPSSKADILEYADRPPILYRKNLRLLSWSKDRPIIFEHRTLDGQWRPLPWEKDGLGIDRFTAVLFLEGKIWAASPIGITAFSRDTNGNVVLDPDNFVMTPGPMIDNKTPSIIDMAIQKEGENNKTVILRGRDEKDYYYKGVLDGQKDTNVFEPLDETAPQVIEIQNKAKVRVSEKESGFWKWERTGPDDMQPGHMRGWFKGEEIKITGGRFGFDGIESIAFFQKGRIEIGTGAGGWYQAPIKEDGDPGFHISTYRRPDVPGINPAQVREIRIGVNEEGERIMGLEIPGEGYIRVGKEGIIGKTANFQTHLGEDGFWRYMKGASGKEGESAGGVTITTVKNPVAGGVKAARRMENGRFTDDIIIGLPVGIIDSKDSNYLIPTRAGVLRLNRALAPVALHPAETLKLPGNTAPAVLFIDRRTTPKQAKPLVLGEDGFHMLNAPDKTASYIKPSTPPGAVVLAIEEGPQDFIRVKWKRNEQRGWTLQSLDDAGIDGANAVFVDLSEFKKFRALNPAPGNGKKEERWMRVKISNGRVEFLRYGSDKVYEKELPGLGELINVVIKGGRLFVIGRTDLFEINGD